MSRHLTRDRLYQSMVGAASPLVLLCVPKTLFELMTGWNRRSWLPMQAGVLTASLTDEGSPLV